VSAGTDWWEVILDGLLSSIVAAVVGAGVALLVVYLTRRGDRTDARLAESKRAAEALARMLSQEGESVARADRDAVRRWISEWNIQSPVLASDELVDRGNDLQAEVVDLIDNAARMREENPHKHALNVYGEADWLRRWWGDREDRLLELIVAFATSLAAHRASRDLPDWPSPGDPPQIEERIPEAGTPET
jgi:hypothetical protein